MTDLKLDMGSVGTPRVMGIGALALLGVAAVFGWSAWTQYRAGQVAESVHAARDHVAGQIGPMVSKAVAAASKAASDPAMVNALQAGDRAAASQAFAAAWTGSRQAEVLPNDLQAQYAGLPATGYGRTALAEAALASGKAATGFAREGGAIDLVVAVPVGAADVAIGGVPAKPMQDAIAQAGLGSGYLALMQGHAVLAKTGDDALADADGTATSNVAGTDAVVSGTAGPAASGVLGLGLLPSAVLALLGLLGAGVLGSRARRAGAPAIDDDEEPAIEDVEPDGPTLSEIAASQPAADIVPAVVAPALAAVPPPPGSVPDAGIFRAYDIRGVVGQTLSVDVARQIGQSIGTVMQEKGLADIVVGRDGRLSGPDLVSGLIDGLRRAGRNVIDIGMAPTPLVYYGAYQLRTGCCVAVTGSHNPPDYNGFKIVLGGETLSGDAITDLHRRIAAGQLFTGETGGLEARDISGDYVERIASDIKLARPLHVVVDAGNGVAGELGPRVLQAIGASVEPLYCDIDGTFPNHHPDPSEPENLEDLRTMVHRLDADIGLAFDGDGDRLGVMTRAGHNIFPDRVLMLFAEDVLERNPGAVIVYDVKCTGALAPFVMGRGGSPLMWKTGHSLIKAKMREEEAELAGEMSGHFFFSERWYGFDDGIYSAARLLEILAKDARTPDEVFAEIPERVSTPEIKVPVDDPHAFVARFVAAGDFEGARITTLDGLRADWNDGFGLVRASNTTPVLVLRFEAATAARLEEIKELFRARLRELDPALKPAF